MRQVTLLFTGIPVAGDGRSHPVCEHDDPLDWTTPAPASGTHARFSSFDSNCYFIRKL